MASSAALAVFLSDPIVSARAATSWVLVIGFDMSCSFVCGPRYGAGLSLSMKRLVVAKFCFAEQIKPILTDLPGLRCVGRPIVP
jgi:hypothetical protein